MVTHISHGIRGKKLLYTGCTDITFYTGCAEVTFYIGCTDIVFYTGCAIIFYSISGVMK